jgi:hypothetical protein
MAVDRARPDPCHANNGPSITGDDCDYLDVSVPQTLRSELVPGTCGAAPGSAHHRAGGGGGGGGGGGCADTHPCGGA